MEVVQPVEEVGTVVRLEPELELLCMIDNQAKLLLEARPHHCTTIEAKDFDLDLDAPRAPRYEKFHPDWKENSGSYTSCQI